MNRSEHLNWCKQRANQYLDQGDIAYALTSMFSDLRKHPETRSHPGIEIGTMLMLAGGLTTVVEVREFIDGFN